MTGAENALVREPARVLAQTGGPAVDVIVPETATRVPCRVLCVQGVDLCNVHALYKAGVGVGSCQCHVALVFDVANTRDTINLHQ